jgi:hypothetical protein
MAEQIISPGVFTRENDLSFLPAGVGAIGAAIVGPTVKGPAFVPTVVRSFAEYERRFGALSSDTFVPQTVREYLKNAGTVTVCRVLAGGGYTLDATNSGAYLVAGQAGVDYSAIGAGFQVDDYGSDSGILLSAILPSKADAIPTLALSSLASGSQISASWGIRLDGATVTRTDITASLVPSQANYLPKTLGYSPNNSKSGNTKYEGTPGYTYLNFKSIQSALQGGLGATNPSADYPGLGQDSIISMNLNNSTNKMIWTGSAVSAPEGYSYASTPMIQSQLQGGSLGNPADADHNTAATKTVKDLFKFHTLNHGSSCNMDYKISISNLREPADIDNEEQYSTFSVSVRKFGDTDKNPVVLEQFNNLTLDPNSPGYIARKIGDRYPQYNNTLGKVEMLGNYPNLSQYIRVEVAAAVEGGASSPKLSPKGFAAVINPIATASLTNNCTFPSASYESVQQVDTSGTYNSKGYLGWKFSEKAQDNNNWVYPLPSIEEPNISGRFNVENYTGHASSGEWVNALSASIDVTGANGPTSNQLKFTVPFQGGEDGVAPWTVKFTGGEAGSGEVNYTTGANLYGFDLNDTGAAGYKGYTKALNILSNQDEYDINMLAMPGIIKEYHPLITNAGIDMCEGRGDAFFVMDLAGKESSVNSAVNTVSGLDTNYAAVYYPWVKVLDTAANKPVFVPPSVIVPGAIAASDRIAAEWFAPAGLNRGVLGNVLEAKIRLNQAERDVLYNAKINPIATFPATGVCIWGQKTLQERPTALDRINVRRLLITLKKFIASSSKYLVFEQNTIQTRDRFLNIVNPYLESVQQRQGLFAFRVQMDESNNTPDVIDRNQLVGGIYLQPAKTAEFIVLDFNILPTGATFPS